MFYSFDVFLFLFWVLEVTYAIEKNNLAVLKNYKNCKSVWCIFVWPAYEYTCCNESIESFNR